MNKNTLFIFGILLLGVFAFTFQSTDNQSLSDGYKIGDTADDFLLKNINGEMYSLEQVKDANGYIVVFTCNHCPYAIKYEQRLIDLHHEMAPKGWPVIAINPNDPEIVPEDGFDEMKERAEEMGYPFVYLFDEDQEVYPKFGATKTPHVFLLDQERIVRYIGAIDNNTSDDPRVDDENGGRIHYVKNAIEALEAGKEPSPDFTRAVGCSIKTKLAKKKKK